MGRSVPGLKFFTTKDNSNVDIDLKIGENSMMAGFHDPTVRFLENDQACWIAYLSGQLPERYDTAWLALQTMLVSEGIFLSGELNREVTSAILYKEKTVKFRVMEVSRLLRSNSRKN